jgi:gluconate kinase
MPDPKNGSHRVKASKLRHALARGQKVDDVDRLWLDEYTQQTKRAERERATSFGRSKSKQARRLRVELDEAAESEAEGTGAAAAAAALAVREEGRRLDNLSIGATSTLREACDVYRDICLTLKDNFEILSNAVVESMMSQRQHYLAAGVLENQLMNAQNEQGDPAKDLLTMLLAKHLGIPIEGLKAVANLPPPRPRPPANGAAAKP